MLENETSAAWRVCARWEDVKRLRSVLEPGRVRSNVVCDPVVGWVQFFQRICGWVCGLIWYGMVWYGMGNWIRDVPRSYIISQCTPIS